MRFHCINFTSFCHWQSNLLFWINLFLSNKKQCDGNFLYLVMASVCFPGVFDLEFGEQWQELEWGTNNSFSCIFTADPQKSVWLVLCIRRLTLIHLSSVLRKFSRVHLKHLHSHSPEAFPYPWGRVSLESSYLSFTSAKDLASDSGSFQSPSDAGVDLQKKPAAAMNLDSKQWFSLGVYIELNNPCSNSSPISFFTTMPSGKDDWLKEPYFVLRSLERGLMLWQTRNWLRKQSMKWQQELFRK